MCVCVSEVWFLELSEFRVDLYWDGGMQLDSDPDLLSFPLPSLAFKALQEVLRNQGSHFSSLQEIVQSLVTDKVEAQVTLSINDVTS